MTNLISFSTSASAASIALKTCAALFLLSASLGACESADSDTSSGATGPGGNNNNATDGGDARASSNATDGSGVSDASNNNNNTPPVLAKGAVDLGLARTYAILSKSGIATVPTSAITGNVGLSPAAASYITGFSLSANATKVFATSPQVTGSVFASDYAVPTPSNLTTAISNMEVAFTDAAGRAPTATELGAGDIGGMTLAPGVYKWGTGLLIPTNVTLAGSSADVWIFQIAKDLTVNSAAKIILSGGAAPRNVFWQVAGLADLGTTAHFEGVLLSQSSIVLRTGASINGRLFAQTAVSIDGSTVVEPSW